MKTPNTQVKCEIVNAQFSWILRVDGQVIPFDGSYNADYFEQHYGQLGYKVERKDEQLK